MAHQPTVTVDRISHLSLRQGLDHFLLHDYVEPRVSGITSLPTGHPNQTTRPPREKVVSCVNAAVEDARAIARSSVARPGVRGMGESDGLGDQDAAALLPLPLQPRSADVGTVGSHKRPSGSEPGSSSSRRRKKAHTMNTSTAPTGIHFVAHDDYVSRLRERYLQIVRDDLPFPPECDIINYYDGITSRLHNTFNETDEYARIEASLLKTIAVVFQTSRDGSTYLSEPLGERRFKRIHRVRSGEKEGTADFVADYMHMSRPGRHPPLWEHKRLLVLPLEHVMSLRTAVGLGEGAVLWVDIGEPTVTWPEGSSGSLPKLEEILKQVCHSLNLRRPIIPSPLPFPLAPSPSLSLCAPPDQVPHKPSSR